MSIWVKRVLRILQIILLLLFSAQVLIAQSSNNRNRYQKHKPSAKFKKNKKMSIICPIFIVNEYPYQGIGFKIGDPFAISYKFYQKKVQFH